MHQHGHSHAERETNLSASPARSSTRALVIVLCLTALVLAVEVAGGFLSGSLALLSDAGHMLADMFAISLALAAQRFAARPATAEKSYGFYRLEILAALANGVLLSLVAIFVFREAASRLLEPHPIRGSLMLWVAVLGLGANLVSAWLLRARGASMNLRGAYLHVVGDAASSVGVIVAALLIQLTGELRIDAVVGALIAAVILWWAIRLVRDAADVLLEGIPKGLHAVEVSQFMRETAGVLEVHDLHVWSLTTGVEALSAHVRVRPEDLPHTDRILRELDAALRERYGIRHTTLQVESEAAAHACPVAD